MNCTQTGIRTTFTRTLSLLGMLVLAVGLAGCGGSEKVSDEENMPEWFMNPPSSENYVYATQSATSQRMQVALDKATNSARGALATQLETKVEGMTKSFTEEVGDDLRQQYTETQKTITSRVLRGTSPKEREVYKQDNGTYRAFVLMELPVGEAAKELLSKIEQNDEMYTRFRASEAFEEMNEAVDEYEREQRRGAARQSDNREEK
jgi:hypothetical protein